MCPQIASAALMCHAPIVIPEVAGPRAREVERTTQAMRDVARSIVADDPDTVVVLSPHTPRLRDAFVIIRGPIHGDFAQFGAPTVSFSMPDSPAARDSILSEVGEHGCMMVEAELQRIDHGAAVPLYFLHEAGWHGPTVLIGFSYSPTHSECKRLGEALRAASDRAGQRFAIIASGDMSHRLIEGAPSGFHPDGSIFDATFRECIDAGDILAASQIDPALRERAAEDVVSSVDIAGASFAYAPRGLKVVSYEGPFGVGYLVALLHHADETRRGGVA